MKMISRNEEEEFQKRYQLWLEKKRSGKLDQRNSRSSVRRHPSTVGKIGKPAALTRKNSDLSSRTESESSMTISSTLPSYMRPTQSTLLHSKDNKENINVSNRNTNSKLRNIVPKNVLLARPNTEVNIKVSKVFFTSQSQKNSQLPRNSVLKTRNPNALKYSYSQNPGRELSTRTPLSKAKDDTTPELDVALLLTQFSMSKPSSGADHTGDKFDPESSSCQKALDFNFEKEHDAGAEQYDNALEQKLQKAKSGSASVTVTAVDDGREGVKSTDIEVEETSLIENEHPVEELPGKTSPVTPEQVTVCVLEDDCDKDVDIGLLKNLQQSSVDESRKQGLSKENTRVDSLTYDPLDENACPAEKDERKSLSQQQDLPLTKVSTGSDVVDEEACVDKEEEETISQEQEKEQKKEEEKATDSQSKLSSLTEHFCTDEEEEKISSSSSQEQNIEQVIESNESRLQPRPLTEDSFLQEEKEKALSQEQEKAAELTSQSGSLKEETQRDKDMIELSSEVKKLLSESLCKPDISTEQNYVTEDTREDLALETELYAECSSESGDLDFTIIPDEDQDDMKKLPRERNITMKLKIVSVPLVRDICPIEKYNTENLSEGQKYDINLSYSTEYLDDIQDKPVVALTTEMEERCESTLEVKESMNESRISMDGDGLMKEIDSTETKVGTTLDMIGESASNAIHLEFELGDAIDTFDMIGESPSNAIHLESQSKDAMNEKAENESSSIFSLGYNLLKSIIDTHEIDLESSGPSESSTCDEMDNNTCEEQIEGKSEPITLIVRVEEDFKSFSALASDVVTETEDSQSSPNGISKHISELARDRMSSLPETEKALVVEDAHLGKDITGKVDVEKLNDDCVVKEDDGEATNSIYEQDDVDDLNLQATAKKSFLIPDDNITVACGNDNNDVSNVVSEFEPAEKLLHKEAFLVVDDEPGVQGEAVVVSEPSAEPETKIELDFTCGPNIEAEKLTSITTMAEDIEDIDPVRMDCDSETLGFVNFNGRESIDRVGDVNARVSNFELLAADQDPKAKDEEWDNLNDTFEEGDSYLSIGSTSGLAEAGDTSSSTNANPNPGFDVNKLISEVKATHKLEMSNICSKYEKHMADLMKDMEVLKNKIEKREIMIRGERKRICSDAADLVAHKLKEQASKIAFLEEQLAQARLMASDVGEEDLEEMAMKMQKYQEKHEKEMRDMREQYKSQILEQQQMISALKRENHQQRKEFEKERQRHKEQQKDNLILVSELEEMTRDYVRIQTQLAHGQLNLF